MAELGVGAPHKIGELGIGLLKKGAKPRFVRASQLKACQYGIEELGKGFPHKVGELGIGLFDKGAKAEIRTGESV